MNRPDYSDTKPHADLPAWFYLWFGALAPAGGALLVLAGGPP